MKALLKKNPERGLWLEDLPISEIGVNDPYTTLEDEVYALLQAAAIDWDGIPRPGRPGEET